MRLITLALRVAPLTLALTLSCTEALAAPVTWTLSGVTFSDGAAATGSFKYDASTNTYSDWSISVGAGTMTAFNYDTSDSMLMTWYNADASGIGFWSNSPTRYINLNFASALTGAGGSVNLAALGLGPGFGSGTDSWECGNCAGLRYINAGRVVGTAAVPEPATLLLVGGALVAAGCVRRRS